LNTQPDLTADILWGAKEIGRFIRRSEKVVWNMHQRGQIPTFMWAGRICARRSKLINFFESQERLSRVQRK